MSPRREEGGGKKERARLRFDVLVAATGAVPKSACSLTRPRGEQKRSLRRTPASSTFGTPTASPPRRPRCGTRAGVVVAGNGGIALGLAHALSLADSAGPEEPESAGPSPGAAAEPSPSHSKAAPRRRRRREVVWAAKHGHVGDAFFDVDAAAFLAKVIGKRRREEGEGRKRAKEEVSSAKERVPPPPPPPPPLPASLGRRKERRPLPLLPLPLLLPPCAFGAAVGPGWVETLTGAIGRQLRRRGREEDAGEGGEAAHEGGGGGGGGGEDEQAGSTSTSTPPSLLSKTTASAPAASSSLPLARRPLRRLPALRVRRRRLCRRGQARRHPGFPPRRGGRERERDREVRRATAACSSTPGCARASAPLCWPAATRARSARRLAARHWFQMRLWSQARATGAAAGRSAAGFTEDGEFEKDEKDEKDENGEEGLLSPHSLELFAHATSVAGLRVILLGLYNGQGLEDEPEEDIVTFCREEEEGGGGGGGGEGEEGGGGGGGGRLLHPRAAAAGRLAGAVLIGETGLEGRLRGPDPGRDRRLFPGAQAAGPGPGPRGDLRLKKKKGFLLSLAVFYIFLVVLQINDFKKMNELPFFLSDRVLDLNASFSSLLSHLRGLFSQVVQRRGARSGRGEVFRVCRT